MYYYCTGIYLDAQFCEHTCKQRENCKYYDLDIYRKYKHIWDEMDFLVCQEPCRNYIPKNDNVKKEETEQKPDFLQLNRLK